MSRRKQVTRLKEYKSASYKFKCAALAPNTHYVATGDSNEVVNIWSMDDNYPILVSFSPQSVLSSAT